MAHRSPNATVFEFKVAPASRQASGRLGNRACGRKYGVPTILDAYVPAGVSHSEAWTSITLVRFPVRSMSP